MPSSRKICQQNTVNCWSNSAVRPRLWMEWTDNVWDRGRTSEDVFIRYTVSPFPSTDAALLTEFIQLLVFFFAQDSSVCSFVFPGKSVSCIVSMTKCIQKLCFLERNKSEWEHCSIICSVSRPCVSVLLQSHPDYKTYPEQDCLLQL